MLKGLNRDFNDLNSNSVKYIYFSNNLNNFLKTRRKKLVYSLIFISHVIIGA